VRAIRRVLDVYCFIFDMLSMAQLMRLCYSKSDLTCRCHMLLLGGNGLICLQKFVIAL